MAEADVYMGTRGDYQRNLGYEQCIQKLDEIYVLLENFLKNPSLDKNLIRGLAAAYPKYEDILCLRRKALHENDYPIIVAGETSAGKSTLLNKIIGKDVFVARHNAATAKIVRVRNSSFMGVRVYSRKGEENTNHAKNFKCLEQLVENVKILTEMDELAEDSDSYQFVDVHIPVSILQGKAILVDTPGVGDNSEFTDMLKEYIPNGICFIFVVNVGNAGGMQEDRMGLILKTIVENRQQMVYFDPEDVIFVTNKWDIIVLGADGPGPNAEEEIGRTWEKVKDKIHRFWPDNKNVFRMNLKDVDKTQETMRPTIDSAKAFNEFQDTLKNIIQQNESKRISMDMNFLEEFVAIAGNGIQLKLQTTNMSEKEKDALIQDCQKLIKDLKEDIEKESNNIQPEIQKYVSDIAKSWNEYLQDSKTKNVILNPEDKKPIMKIGKMDLQEEVNGRCVEAIHRLWKREDITEAKRKLQHKILENTRRFQEDASKIEKKIEGVKNSSAKASVDVGIKSKNRLHVSNYIDLKDVPVAGFVAGVLVLSPIWIPVAIIGGTVYLIGRGVQSIFRFANKMIGFKETKIDEYYKDFMAQYSFGGLKRDLEFHFANYFKNLLKQIDKKIKERKLGSLSKTIEALKKDKGNSNELSVVKSLNDELSVIREQLKDFKSSI